MPSIIGLICCLRRWHLSCCDLSLSHLYLKIEVFDTESTHVICPYALTGILWSHYELRTVSESRRAEALWQSNGHRDIQPNLPTKTTQGIWSLCFLFTGGL
ncbi:hypothetical protein DPMN_124842 [Dreissena polymorpha]|uniref:Uncharacterized protein n=1 Tax=Dreissena polymorpha TaxID=45954 RepID=A0A9D4GX29_DREPO|nr:hypothetical protein DPMN_124842 [Dreissena polymorpha]